MTIWSKNLGINRHRRWFIHMARVFHSDKWQPQWNKSLQNMTSLSKFTMNDRKINFLFVMLSLFIGFTCKLLHFDSFIMNRSFIRRLMQFDCKNCISYSLDSAWFIPSSFVSSFIHDTANGCTIFRAKIAKMAHCYWEFTFERECLMF